MYLYLKFGQILREGELKMNKEALLKTPKPEAKKMLQLTCIPPSEDVSCVTDNVVVRLLVKEGLLSKNEADIVEITTIHRKYFRFQHLPKHIRELYENNTFDLITIRGAPCLPLGRKKDLDEVAEYIIKFVSNHLKPRGLAIVEFDMRRFQASKSRYQRRPFYVTSLGEKSRYISRATKMYTEVMEGFGFYNFESLLFEGRSILYAEKKLV